MTSLQRRLRCGDPLWRGVFAAAAVLALSACATIQNVERNIQATQETATGLRESLVSKAASGAVIRTSRPRLSGEEIVVKTSPLPAVFNEKISYVTKGSQTLVDALEDVAASSGLAIRSAEIAPTANAGGAMPPPGLAGSGPLTGSVTLDYSGSLRGLLDEVAGKADCSWRYNAEKRVVEFFRYETRTFNVNVPPGAKDVASSISLAGVTGGGGGGGGGSSGAGNVSISHSLKIDPWSSLMDGVRSILADGRSAGAAAGPGAGAGPSAGARSVSAFDGSAIANPELGLVTVTAKPVLLDRVGRYVASINSRFARNILMDVRIFSVTLNDQASAGLNVNLLYDRINKVAGMIAGPAPMHAGTSTPGLFTIASTKLGSKWDNSTLVVEALSQYGKVALVKQTNLLAVNGQPAPLQVANEISYVSASQTTLTTGAGAQVSQTTSQKVVGFTAFFTPLILGDNRILLSYQLQISALAQPLTPNASGVQTPNIASQSLPGQAFVRDGDAIVLFGFDEQRDGTDHALHPAGTSKAVTRERQMMVVVVQVNTGERNDVR